MGKAGGGKSRAAAAERKQRGCVSHMRDVSEGERGRRVEDVVGRRTIGHATFCVCLFDVAAALRIAGYDSSSSIPRHYHHSLVVHIHIIIVQHSNLPYCTRAS